MMSATSRISANATASVTLGVKTLKDTKATTASGGTLESVPNCCATRTSLARVEMPMPTQIDQLARSGAKRISATICGPCRKGRHHLRVAREEAGADLDDGEDDIGDADRGNNDTERLAEQQLLAAQRGGQQGFEGALLALADHGVRGNDSRQQSGRDQQYEKRAADGLIHCACRDRRAEAKDGEQGFDEEDERGQRHGPDDEGAAPVLTELLAEHRTQTA